MFRKREHKHESVPIAVDSYGPNLITAMTPKTYVLWRCPGCGGLSVQTLNGKWSLSQINQPERPKIEHIPTTDEDRKLIEAAAREADESPAIDKNRIKTEPVGKSGESGKKFDRRLRGEEV